MHMSKYDSHTKLIHVRHSVLQMSSYSTYNSLSYNMGAWRHIWTTDTLSNPTHNRGYIRMPEIFKAMEAMRAKEKEATAKAIAKEKEVATKVVTKLGDPGSLIKAPNV